MSLKNNLFVISNLKVASIFAPYFTLTAYMENKVYQKKFVEVPIDLIHFQSILRLVEHSELFYSSLVENTIVIGILFLTLICTTILYFYSDILKQGYLVFYLFLIAIFDSFAILIFSMGSRETLDNLDANAAIWNNLGPMILLLCIIMEIFITLRTYYYI